MKIIKKILIKLLDNKDIENEYLSRFTEDISMDSLDKEAGDILLQEISRIENIDEYLTTVIKKDRVRYFNSPKESLDLIKGAALRAIWLLKEIRGKRELGDGKSEKVVKAKYNNPRHG